MCKQIYLAFKKKKKPNDCKNTSSKNIKKAPTGKNREWKIGIWMSKLQCQQGFWKLIMHHHLYISKITSKSTSKVFRILNSSCQWLADHRAIMWDLKTHFWWPNSNRRERGCDRELLLQTHCVDSYLRCALYIIIFFFFSPPGKAQRGNFNDGQVDRNHEWVTWNLFFTFGFVWKTAEYCKKKNTSPCDYPIYLSLLS